MTDIVAGATTTYVQHDGKPFGAELLESLERMKGASAAETSAVAMITSGISSLSGFKARNGSLHEATEHVLDVLIEKIETVLDGD